MIFTTQLLCKIPLQLTDATIFVTASTYLLYNFHKHSFLIDYSEFKKIIATAKKIRLKISEVIGYSVAAILVIVYFFKLHRLKEFQVAAQRRALRSHFTILRMKAGD